MANLPTTANTSNAGSNTNTQIVNPSVQVNLIDQIPITQENVEKVSLFLKF